MKTDFELKRDVEAELAWDPQVRSTEVGVAAKDGVVTVTGHLDTFAEKEGVMKALRRVGGVKAIALELDVRLSPEHVRSDTEIARSCESALRWNTLVPHDRVRVTVDGGHVTLQGELEWAYQRRAIEPQFAGEAELAARIAEAQRSRAAFLDLPRSTPQLAVIAELATPSRGGGVPRRDGGEALVPADRLVAEIDRVLAGVPALPALCDPLATALLAEEAGDARAVVRRNGDKQVVVLDEGEGHA